MNQLNPRNIIIWLQVVLFGLGFHLIGRSQDEVAIVRTFGSDFGEEANQIIECSDGGYVVVGTTGGDVMNISNIYVLRLDSDLNCLWNKVLGTDQVDIGNSIIEDEDGNFLVCGYTNGMGSGGYDALLIKLNAVGELLWQHTFGGSDWDFAKKVENIPSLGYLFCGYSFSNSQGESDAWLVHLNNEGDVIAEWKFGDERSQSFNDILIYDDSTIYVGGSFEMNDGNSPPWLVSLDLSGVVYWEKLFVQYAIGECNGIEKSEDGTVLIIGSFTSEVDGENAFIGKYFVDGSLFFDQISDNFEGMDIAEGQDYFYIVGNTSDFGAGGYGVYFARYTLDGNWIIGASFGGELNEYGRSVITDNSGAIIFAGTSESYSNLGSKDIYVVKFEEPVTVADYNLDIVQQACFTVGVEDTNVQTLDQWMSTTDGIRLESESKLTRVEVYNSVGQCFYHAKCFCDDFFIPEMMMPSGIFIVSWTNENGEMFQQRIFRN